MKSKIIAISAISAGFVALFLIIGGYFQLADIFCTIISSVFVLMPLYFNSYKGSLLSYLAGGVVALVCSLPTLAFSFVLPAYAIFFGIYPIVKNLLVRNNLDKRIRFFIGLIWCVLSVYGVYFYYTAVMGLTLQGLPEVVSEYILIFIGILAVIFFIIYDKFLYVSKMVLDRYLNRIIK